jgi:type II secretory pathway pseudopilin PulG
MSLLEVIIVIAILGSLVILAVPMYKKVQNKMKKVVCISRMKRIYHALDDYVKENGHWPQQPSAEEFVDESDEWEWWVTTMKDYGVDEEHWLCPVEATEMRKAPSGNQLGISYIPSAFDRRQMTPYRWNQPWLLERGNFHEDGNHMLMPDGSVKVAPVRASF